MSLLINTKSVNNSNISEVIKEALSKPMSDGQPQKLERLIIRPNTPEPERENHEQQKLNLKANEQETLQTAN